MKFEWDKNKADINLQKHGIHFSEASTVFADPLEITINDPAHSIGEYRFLSIAKSEQGRLLVVSYTERQENNIALSVPDLQPNRRENTMKTITDEAEEMLPEYDFSKGVRGKHFKAYQENTNVIFLEDDVAKIFKSSEAVNHALRMLINIAHQEIQNA